MTALGYIPGQIIGYGINNNGICFINDLFDNKDSVEAVFCLWAFPRTPPYPVFSKKTFYVVRQIVERRCNNKISRNINP